MTRVLVIWRESRRVCGFGDFASNDLFQSVEALARGVEGVHEMHVCGFGCVQACGVISSDVISQTRSQLCLGLAAFGKAERVDGAKEREPWD